MRKYNYVQQNMYNESLDIFNDDCCWRCDHITERKNGVGKCKHQVEAIDRVGKCDKYQGLTVVEQMDKDILANIREQALSTKSPVLDTSFLPELGDLQKNWMKEQMKTIRQMEKRK